MNNKIGIFMNFWENKWEADHLKYIKKAAEIGYDVLEFQAQALLNMSDERMGELKNAADECGIELTYSLGLDPKYDISSLDENVRKAGINYLTEIVKKIGKMDGKLLSGVSYAGWGVPEKIDKAAAFEYSVNGIKTVSKIAEEFGIVYGIEAVNRFEGIILNTAKEAVDYVKAVDRPNVGVLLDTYHMNIEESNIGDAIRLAGDYLVAFHVGENNRTCPGRGHLDWDEIFGALATVGYKGRLVAEPFVVSGDEVGNAIYVWRDLIENKSEQYRDKEAKYMLDFMRNKITNL